MSPVTNTPRPTATPNTAPTAPAAGPPTPPSLDDAETLPTADASAASTAPEKRAPKNDVDAAVATARRAQMATFISGDGADAAALGLLRLPNADLKDAVLGLATANPEKFGQFLDAIDSGTRDHLVRRLEHSGVFSSTPAVQTPVPPRAPTPPPGPSLLKDDPSLPRQLRDLAQQKNLATTTAYVAAYEGYREQYGAAVDGAKSVAGLRALGPSAAPALPENLPTVSGKVSDTPDNHAFRKARGDNVDDVAMTTRVADKMRTLTGRSVAGMSFTLEGKAMITLFGVGGGAAVGVTRNSDGTVDFDRKFSAEGKVGDVAYKVDEDGVEIESSSKGPDGTTSSGMVAFGKDRVGVGALGNSVTVDNVKGLELEADFGAMSGKAGFNGDNVSYSMKAGKEFGGDRAKIALEVEAGFVAQGITKADRDAFVSTSEVGFYDTPPELQRGKGWSTLPADIKADYQAQGWTEKEWSDAAVLKKPMTGLR
jgi:hypothetical protein